MALKVLKPIDPFPWKLSMQASSATEATVELTVNRRFGVQGCVY